MSLFTALALALAGPVQAVAPPAPPVVAKPAPKALPPAAFTSGPVREDARRLAQLIIPEDLYLAFTERVVASGIRQYGEQFTELEQEHPGVVDALAIEFGRIGRAHAKELLPQTYDRYARALAAHFTPASVVELSDFYRSRSGQKLIVGKFAGYDFGPMLEKWSEDPDAGITESEIAELNRDAVGKVFEHLDRSDIDALLAFARKPAFASLRAFAPTMVALEAQIASEPDAALEAKMEKAMIEVMGRFKIGSETS